MCDGEEESQTKTLTRSTWSTALSPSYGYLRRAYCRTRSAGVPLWSRRLGVVRLLGVPLLALSTVSIPPSYLAILFGLEPDLTESVDGDASNEVQSPFLTVSGTGAGGQTQDSCNGESSESLNPNAWPNSSKVKPPVCIRSPRVPAHFSHRLFLSRNAQIFKESVSPTSFTSSSLNGSS